MIVITDAEREHVGEKPHRLHPSVALTGNIPISLPRLAQLKSDPTFRPAVIEVYAIAPPSPFLWVHASQCLASLVMVDEYHPMQ